jgi:hypothetical protein
MLGKLFEKKFKFDKSRFSAVLPATSELFSSTMKQAESSPLLQRLKIELNTTKEKLDHMDLQLWGR